LKNLAEKMKVKIVCDDSYEVILQVPDILTFQEIVDEVCTLRKTQGGLYGSRIQQNESSSRPTYSVAYQFQSSKSSSSSSASDNHSEQQVVSTKLLLKDALKGNAKNQDLIIFIYGFTAKQQDTMINSLYEFSSNLSLMSMAFNNAMETYSVNFPSLSVESAQHSLSSSSSSTASKPLLAVANSNKNNTNPLEVIANKIKLSHQEINENFDSILATNSLDITTRSILSRAKSRFSLCFLILFYLFFFCVGSFLSGDLGNTISILELPAIHLVSSTWSSSSSLSSSSSSGKPIVTPHLLTNGETLISAPTSSNGLVTKPTKKSETNSSKNNTVTAIPDKKPELKLSDLAKKPDVTAKKAIDISEPVDVDTQKKQEKLSVAAALPAAASSSKGLKDQAKPIDSKTSFVSATTKEPARVEQTSKTEEKTKPEPTKADATPVSTLTKTASTVAPPRIPVLTEKQPEQKSSQNKNKEEPSAKSNVAAADVSAVPSKGSKVNGVVPSNPIAKKTNRSPSISSSGSESDDESSSSSGSSSNRTLGSTDGSTAKVAADNKKIHDSKGAGFQSKQQNRPIVSEQTQPLHIPLHDSIDDIFSDREKEKAKSKEEKLKVMAATATVLSKEETDKKARSGSISSTASSASLPVVPTAATAGLVKQSPKRELPTTYNLPKSLQSRKSDAAAAPIASPPPISSTSAAPKEEPAKKSEVVSKVETKPAAVTVDPVLKPPSFSLAVGKKPSPPPIAATTSTPVNNKKKSSNNSDSEDDGNSSSGSSTGSDDDSDSDSEDEKKNQQHDDSSIGSSGSSTVVKKKDVNKNNALLLTNQTSVKKPLPGSARDINKSITFNSAVKQTPSALAVCTTLVLFVFRVIFLFFFISFYIRVCLEVNQCLVNHLLLSL
jgi:hypothetical protein